MDSADQPEPVLVSPQHHGVDDEFLIAGLAGGDAAALSKLMDRYDRLVRFAIFRASKDRCRQDPQWLDSVASATWEGFVVSVRRSPKNRPKIVKAFLVQIARNQVVNALRRASAETATASVDDYDVAGITATQEDPADLLARLELIEAIRACLTGLDPDDRPLASQLSVVLDRRWKEAAETLGVPESTLRSRWKVLLQRLHDCVAGRTERWPDFSEEGLAPRR